ncbi:MAG: FdtA/QdtA family cupin domain-containing protein [Muribaculaceae bacterium]|nr:FdtA/QdtA family cupin domain-containing protein [Muribaculaceae bacterium]
MKEVPHIIQLPRHLDPRGNLAVIEEGREVPFKIARCHWIYDVPGGGGREGHAYFNNRELIIALSGSFDVIVTDGEGTHTFTLNRSYMGLYIPPLTWRELTNFSTNAVVVVVSSLPFDEKEYIPDFDEYKKLIEKNE